MKIKYNQDAIMGVLILLVIFEGNFIYQQDKVVRGVAASVNLKKEESDQFSMRMIDYALERDDLAQKLGEKSGRISVSEEQEIKDYLGMSVADWKKEMAIEDRLLRGILDKKP